LRPRFDLIAVQCLEDSGEQAVIFGDRQRVDIPALEDKAAQ